MAQRNGQTGTGKETTSIAIHRLKLGKKIGKTDGENRRRRNEKGKRRRTKEPSKTRDGIQQNERKKRPIGPSPFDARKKNAQRKQKRKDAERNAAWTNGRDDDDDDDDDKIIA